MIFIILILSIIFLAYALWWGNNSLKLTRYTISNDKIPASFNEYRIIHLSDIHNKNFKGSLSKRCSELKPDLIVISGDLVYKHEDNYQYALELVDELDKICDVYFVSGNHEQWYSHYHLMKRELIAHHVRVLVNENIILKRNNDSINLIGMDDISFINGYDYGVKEKAIFADILHSLNHKEQFNLVLSHRPELMDRYVKEEVDLVMCGHVHGGQIRIPFIGGIIAPNQGWFPKYDYGRYDEHKTTMIISAGLGKSAFPFRINNRPQINLITLCCNVKK